MAKLGIIGGTGVDESIVKAQNVVFLNRHGKKYRAPHEIDYRGNILKLKGLGVSKIVATAAVGSLNPKMKPGDFVLLSDFIDFTRGRIEYIEPKKFTDVSFPYDESLRKKIQTAAKKLKIKIHSSAVYACTEGPRFESKAEIKMLRILGADVVGMTQVPEVVLAAEAGTPYAVIGVVTNYAAGIKPSKLSSDEVVEVMKSKQNEMSKLLRRVIAGI